MNDNYTIKEIESLLENNFNKFCKKWRAILNGSEIQTLAKFISEVKEEINYDHEQDFSREAQLEEDFRLSESYMAMNNPKFFE